MKFRNHARSYEDEMIQHYNISAVTCSDTNNVAEHSDDDIFNISQITTELVNSPQIRDPEITSSYNHGISAINVAGFTSKTTLKKRILILEIQICQYQVYSNLQKGIQMYPLKT